ncbi:MAG: hypothetical protein AAF649_02500 [Verrucomicrobiota bacterium]
MNQDKKKEWSTYRRLKLQRQHKSRAKREVIEKEGIYCFIGGTRGRPYMQVLKTDYLRIFKAEEQALRQSDLFKKITPDRAADLMRNHLENIIYDRLLSHMQALAKVEETTLKNEGRSLSSNEREIYSKALKDDPVQLNHESRATTTRKRWIQSVLSKVNHRSQSNPSHLQHTWQDLVGVENAQQVRLTYVDKKRGIAYCQSINPSATASLRMQRNLAQLLGQSLDLRITRIVYR